MVLDKLKTGYELVMNIWEKYGVNSETILVTNGWKASINIIGNVPFAGATVILEGHGLLFVMPSVELGEQLLPASKEDYSGLIELVTQEKLNHFNRYKMYAFNDTFWKDIYIPRLAMYDISRLVDLFNEGLLTESEKSKLSNKFFNLDDHDVKEMLKRSRVKFNDTEKQLNLLLDIKLSWVEKLIDIALIDFRKKPYTGETYPVIYFINQPSEAVLTQMCAWAYRQSIREIKYDSQSLDYLKIELGLSVINKMQENELVEYIQKYVKKIVNKVLTIPSEYKDLCCQEVTLRLIGTTTGKNKLKIPYNSNSFNAYIKKTANGYFQNELKATLSEGSSLNAEADRANYASSNILNLKIDTRHDYNKPKNISNFPISISKATKLLIKECDYRYKPSSLERRLYTWMNEGVIKNCGDIRRKTIKEGIIITKKTYLLDSSALKQARKILEKEKRKDEQIEYRRKLMRQIVENRGITERGARKWLKNKKDKGMSLEEIDLIVKNE